MPSTLFEKLWERHVVREEPGEPALLYVDVHLVHEVTSAQAFEGLRLAGRPVRRPELTTLASFMDPNDNNLTKSLCRNASTGSQQFATRPVDTNGQPTGTQYTACPTGFTRLDPFEERFFGDTWMPRVAIGAGVNWNSPFGPFRIDFAYALRKEEGDDTKRFSFNVGTQF